MRVKDYMTGVVASVSPSTGIKEIYHILQEKNIGGLPVIDKENKLVGIITKNELLTAILPDYFDMIDDFLFIDDFGALEEELEHLPELKLFIAEDLMVRNIVAVKEDASLLKVPALMDKYNVNRLPVVDKDNKLIGIITKMDLCRAYFSNDKESGG